VGRPTVITDVDLRDQLSLAVHPFANLNRTFPRRSPPPPLRRLGCANRVDACLGKPCGIAQDLSSGPDTLAGTS
jgi:hypothetical protein